MSTTISVPTARASVGIAALEEIIPSPQGGIILSVAPEGGDGTSPRPSTSKGAIPKVIIKKREETKVSAYDKNKGVKNVSKGAIPKVSAKKREKSMISADDPDERARKPANDLPRHPPALPRYTITQLAESQPDERKKPKLPIIRKGRMFRGLKEIPTDPKLDPPEGVCHNCWRGGHGVKGCPQPRKLMCNNCGRRGVTLTECPRCSEVHRRDMERRHGARGFQTFRNQRAVYYSQHYHREPRDEWSRPLDPVATDENKNYKDQANHSEVPRNETHRSSISASIELPDEDVISQRPVFSPAFPECFNKFPPISPDEPVDVPSADPGAPNIHDWWRNAPPIDENIVTVRNVNPSVPVSAGSSLLAELRELDRYLQGLPEELVKETRIRFFRELQSRKN